MKFVVKSAGEYLCCDSPEFALQANTLGEVHSVLARIEQLQTEGYFVAGWISYEAAPAFDSHFKTHSDSSFPLLLMLASRQVSRLRRLEAPEQTHAPIEVIPNIDQVSYEDRYRTLIELIHAGDLYQANYSFRAKVDTDIDAYSLFCRLENQHPAPYASYIEYGEWRVVSSSPELFLERHGPTIKTEPMKGTAARGLWYEDDEYKRRWLEDDLKNRAENLMIVDLMRNDLSKICASESVHVPKLFEAKRFSSLFQLVSEVAGELKEQTSLMDILTATFPAGSITGAPKVRSMEVIHELEPDARKAYTGSVGIFFPGGDFMLNVAIRTLTINAHDNASDAQQTRAEIGIGSGVVSHSNGAEEWQECLLKGEFLNHQTLYNEVFETILWNSGYQWCDEHLARMKNSCCYFGVPFVERAARDLLDNLAASLHESGFSHYRVRLAVSREGILSVAHVRLSDLGWGREAIKVQLTDEKIDEHSPYQFHKTDRRSHYDMALRACTKARFSEVLFMNSRNQLVEGAISNLFIQLEGQWLTPEISSGLLPGIWRQKILSQCKVQETRISYEMLLQSDQVVIGNSVRSTGNVAEIWSGGQCIWVADSSPVISLPLSLVN